jgi:hypothetical protein
VVDFHCASVDLWFERVVCVAEFWKFVSHNNFTNDMFCAASSMCYHIVQQS